MAASVRRFVFVGVLGLAAGLLPVSAAQELRLDGPREEFTLAGDARRSDQEPTVRLVPHGRFRRGALWSAKRQSVENGFETTFQFRIINCGSVRNYARGADGIVFVVQNTGPAAVGGAGGLIGYGGIPNSLAVEFDTYHNAEFSDPNENHVSIHSAGTRPVTVNERLSLGGTTDVPDMKDGRPHTARVVYDPKLPQSLSVFLDDSASAVVTATVNLARLLKLDGGQAYVGLTSATGNAWEDTDVLRWTFHPLGGEPETPAPDSSAATAPAGSFGGNGVLSGVGR